MNRHRVSHAIALAAFVLGTPAAALEHRETVKRTFDLKGRTLVVDNINGAIEIEGGSGGTVELTLEQVFTARSSDELARARREVEFEVEEPEGRLELIQGGTWRCRDHCKDGTRRNCFCQHEDRDYEVRFDWTLRVPSELELEVRNVNEGAIRVAGIRGRLDVGHVNDAVTLDRVGGAVSAHTVNGPLEVSFTSKPVDDCRFGTVNGKIDLTFPKGFGAELSFESLNGEVYTDFPFVLAKLPATAERSTQGKRRHHGLGRKTRATIGSGGIGLECSTINGDIYIRERS